MPDAREKAREAAYREWANAKPKPLAVRKGYGWGGFNAGFDAGWDAAVADSPTEPTDEEVRALATRLCAEAWVRHGNTDGPCGRCLADAKRYLWVARAVAGASSTDSERTDGK